METVYSEIKGNVKIEVRVDDHPSNPREWDNVGKMVCFHRRYSLGDKNTPYKSADYLEWKELKRDIMKNEDVVAIFPLYLYDHSGITISTSPFGCAWDSGQVGWIYATRKDVREAYGVKKVTKQIVEKVEQCLQSEVKTYDGYISGEVYEYRVYKIDVCEKGHKHLELEDSVGGYYNLEECIEEAKSHL